MNARESTPALSPGVIYLAWDRFVCVQCAGYTAIWTGRSIGGVQLIPIRDRDVIECARYGLGPLRCECGALTATYSMAEGLVVERA